MKQLRWTKRKVHTVSKFEIGIAVVGDGAHSKPGPYLTRPLPCYLDIIMTDSANTLSTHTETTAEIVAAYVARNSVPVAELPNLIRSIHGALAGLGSAPAVEVAAAPLVPAVSVKKSITDEYLISLEDGRKLKSMKRYLSGLGMTPAEYRAKWGLPTDYPMVAPAYAARRSELAKTIGLGRKAVSAAPAPVAKAAEPANDAGGKSRKRTAKAA